MPLNLQIRGVIFSYENLMIDVMQYCAYWATLDDIITFNSKISLYYWVW